MVESDQDRLLLLQDWGVCVTLKKAGRSRKVIKGIFDAAYTEIEVGGSIGFASASPRLVCRSLDLAGAEDADSCTIGNDKYLIRVIQPDGTGMTELMLEKQ